MQKYTDTVIKDGKPIQGLTITVANYPTGTPATFYSSTGSLVTSVQTDANGRFEFYAPNGHYSLTVSGAGINPYTLNDIVLFDAADQGVAAMKGAGGVALQSLLDSKAPNVAPTFTGNVGIGTSTTDVPLHIATPNGTRSFIRMQQVGFRDWYMGIPASSLRFSITDGSAGVERLSIDENGNVLSGVTSGSCHTLYKNATGDAGVPILAVGTTSPMAQFFAVTLGSGGANAANAALKIGKDALTSRGISTYGTVNASGADYAEYMTKADDCGILTKGQIVGVDAVGKLTDKWAVAVSFLIKSTDPSYVGGDTWGTPGTVGLEPPVEPTFQVPQYTGFPQPGNAPLQPPPGPNVTDAERASYEAALAQYHADLIRFDQEWTAYVANVVAQRDQFETITMGEYRAALAAFNAALEEARQRVDRIAYCGQVPVNVRGAVPGQYVVPMQVGDGIGGQLVNDSDITFSQYRRAVGVVQNILSDGRANVRVKVV